VVPCRNLRICAWLATFVVLSVLSSGVACANDSDDPHLGSLGDYLTAGKFDERILEDSLLGLTLCEDRRQLKSGASARGLLIVAVRKGSPAANAGLAALRTTPKEVVSGIVAAGSLAFPPAILLLLFTNLLPNGVGGDLIIATDGSRVRTRLDYQNEIRDAQRGEIVYLTIMRGGVPKQVAVPIPAIGN
jgi:S1-C subfamily serine protease